MAQLTSLISMKRAPSVLPIPCACPPPFSSQRLYTADLGHPITRSSMIRDLGDVQIDLSRKYPGREGMVMGGIGTDRTELSTLYGASTS